MRVDVITIHRILNCGSALQAYATQQYLLKLGHTCRIIDYRYPTKENKLKRYRSMPFMKSVRLFLHFIKEDLKKNVKAKRVKFEEFWSTRLILTKPYNSHKELLSEKWDADVYIVGSDQVWNTKTLLGDSAFLLSFLPDSVKRFSYSSSFALDTFDDKYRDLFLKQLHKFDAISVREKSGLKILDGLDIKRNIYLVCDPVFLLEKESYLELAKSSKYKFDFDYILVYPMVYAFNPGPAMLKSVFAALEKYNCKIVFISSVLSGYNGDYILVDDADPQDFLYLISHATFVITSSFHVTAFSVIFRKFFITIVPTSGDRRMSDFLETIGLTPNMVKCNEESVAIVESKYTPVVESLLYDYIESSKKFIIDQLSNYDKNNR